MIEWHHWIYGYKLEQILRDSEGQGSLAVLQSVGFQKVGQNWAIEQKQQKIGERLMMVHVLWYQDAGIA